MKTRLLLFIILVISITIPAISFAQKPPDCTFGDQTNLDHIFEKDFTVKAFTEKHQNATRSIPNESNTINNIVFQAKKDSIKEALEIKFSTDEKGCFIPASYHYFYDDGIINATARNSVANFTEIMNLIKSNDKSIEDFYPDDCDFVDLDVTITSGKSFGICKETHSRSITILIDSNSNGTLKVDIPIKILYSLPSKDCKPTGDFFVELDEEEARSEITSTDIGNSVKIEFPKGFHKIRIMGMVIIPDPSPDQYCGIVEGYLDKKYLAPLDQTDNGVAFKFIQCNEDLVLIQKYDDTPACVKSETIGKLIERGWALPELKPESNLIPQAPERLLSEIGNQTLSFENAKQETGLSNAFAPSYIPSGYALDSVRTISDNGIDHEITMIYLPSGIKSSEQTSIQQMIKDGMVVSIKSDKNGASDWNASVKKQVQDAPEIRSSILINNNEILLIQNNPEIDYPFAAKTFKDNLRIEIFSQKLDTDILKSVIISMVAP